jgi:excinuclease ABC subunit C
VEWVLAEQKVTGFGGGEAEIRGFAGGRLVRFGVRDGRLYDWRSEPCTAGAARAYVAGTAPHWRAFAERNAALAARLAAP